MFNELAVPLPGELVWEVETVSWHSNQDWNRFDLVVARTTMGDNHAPMEFRDTLREIDGSKTHLSLSNGILKRPV